MSKTSREVGVWCRCVIAMLISTSVLAGSLSAQGSDDGEGSVSAIIEGFEQAWNDQLWKPRYMRPLDDIGWKRRVRALQMSAQHGQAASADLVKALESESTPVRALAAQALGFSDASGARPALAHVVERDTDPMVRLYAVDSLGMLGGHEYDELLRRLEKSEKNRDTKRHIGYALVREGQAVNATVGQRLRQWNVEQLASAKLGQPAPDFELTSLDGRHIRLSDFQGKKSVVLIFVYGDT